ncbi:MAG: hypothetical protein V2J55_08655 [Candidatus Competibacteraceae bacterium]|jgi:hypothetical protein|nr:hypothetical protein [Candidatus Competibacteraceae bacterium]
MNLSRRQFTVSALFLPVGSLFGLSATGSEKRAPNASIDAEFTQAFTNLQQQLISFLEAAGYQQIPAQSLITGHAFNGGLRYDDSGVLAKMPNGEMVVQDCARVEDIPNKNRRGVLPFFHILACTRRADSDQDKTFSETINLVTKTLELPSQRLALVSIAALADFRDLLTEQDIDWERQVVIRDTEEAKATGNGSGYFNPAGHPEQPEFITAGLYIWTGEGQAPAIKTYPLSEQWVEIGEVGLDKTATLAFGFGLERLVYAKTGLLPSWQEQRQQLLETVKAESAKTGAPLPEGYTLFKDDMA